VATPEARTSTVFILGAGASAKGGVPVMKDFLDVAEMLWRTNQVGDAADDFRAVFEGQSRLQAVFAKANIDVLNIEDVFAAFEMGKTLASLPGYSESEIDSLLHSMRVAIVKTIGRTQQYGKDSSGRFWPPDPYQDFAVLIGHLRNQSRPAHDVSIITFNYDVGCEHGLYTEGVKYSYYVGDYEDTPDYMPLLKLHGSLNWGQDANGRPVPFRMEDFFEGTKRYTPTPGPNQNHWILDIGSRLEGCENLRNVHQPEPFLVPPTWNKTGYYKEIAGVWRKAAQVLSDADNIFVSGYSLPRSDAFFRYLYALGTVGEGLLRRFWVFDPENEGGAVDKRFRKLLSQSAQQRYKYWPISFEDAIAELSKIFT
jgi:hypothetical protein